MSAQGPPGAGGPPNFDPSKFDPSKFDPSKFPNFDPSKFDPSKFDPSKFDPSKLPNFDPSKFDPSKFDPSKFDPSKFDPSKFDPSKFDPSKAGGMRMPPFDMSVFKGVENPYLWPLIVRNFGQEFNGVPVQLVPKLKTTPLDLAKERRVLPLRPDDIFLNAFPKCGTHWVSEIVSMLLRGSTTYNKQGKEKTMLDVLADLSTLEDVPSPRLFNSHLYFAQLPEGIVKKKCKIIHVIRNPKDTAVSWYHHLKAFPMNLPGFNFELFLKGYFTEWYSSYGHQFGYMRQMGEFEKANPNHPIIHVHYEDLKAHPLPIVKKLAKFLGKEASDEFCKEIIEACGFKKLKTAEIDRTVEHMKAMQTAIYRKGIVGDWKNSFTVAQNERFDEFINEQKKLGIPYEFKGL